MKDQNISRTLSGSLRRSGKSSRWGIMIIVIIVVITITEVTERNLKNWQDIVIDWGLISRFGKYNCLRNLLN